MTDRASKRIGGGGHGRAQSQARLHARGAHRAQARPHVGDPPDALLQLGVGVGHRLAVVAHARDDQAGVLVRSRLDRRGRGSLVLKSRLGACGGARGEAQAALGWLIRLLGGVFDAHPREVDGAVVAVERDGEGRFGILGDGQVAGQNVAGAHGDDAHAHAGSGHAGGDGANGSISARGDDHGGSLLEGTNGLPCARVLARGLAPVHVVDAQFLGLAVDAILEGLGVLVLGGVHDDPGTRTSARRVVHRGGDLEGAAAPMPAGEGGCQTRDSDRSGSGGGCECPVDCVHVHKPSLRSACG